MVPPIGPYSSGGSSASNQATVNMNGYHGGQHASASHHHSHQHYHLNLESNKVASAGSSHTAINSLSSSSNNGNNASSSRSNYSSNFWETYEYMCSVQNQMPLQFIKQSLTVDAGSHLAINADRIK
jgi:hypothetical protein